jgi:hypothetical protein
VDQGGLGFGLGRVDGGLGFRVQVGKFGQRVPELEEVQGEGSMEQQTRVNRRMLKKRETGAGTSASKEATTDCLRVSSRPSLVASALSVHRGVKRRPMRCTSGRSCWGW